MSPDLIPAVDPVPLPGPAWLFHLLLVLTFFLHMPFLYLTLGGSLLAAVSKLTARGEDHRAALASRLTAVNTFAISLTITTGIAPLLFIQALYQQYFYTATILIGSAWLMLVVLLIGAYYSTYLFKLGAGSSGGSRGGIWLAVAALGFLLIAGIQVAVNLIHSHPGTWAGIADNPWSILAAPAYLPRLLHFVLAGLVLSALLSSWWARRRSEAGDQTELNQQIALYGWSWAKWATVALALVGLARGLVLPGEVLRGVAGSATLIPAVIGVGLIVLLIVVLFRKAAAQSPALTTTALSAMIGIMAMMAIVRHQVRVNNLASAHKGFELVVAPQWGTFVLFAVLLVAGLAVVAYMVKRVLASPATGDEAA
jgi:hypothetical protein